MSRSKKDGKCGGNHKKHSKCIEFRDGTSGCWNKKQPDHCIDFKKCVICNKGCKDKFRKKKVIQQADISYKEQIINL